MVASTSLFETPIHTLAGEASSLAPYAGQVLLIVNVASECGFTPQYQGLEALQQKFSGQGFSVLGFPCNQFGGQEPGSSEQIALFCREHFKVTFPLFEKIDVNGAHAHPLFRALKSAAPGLLGTEAIKWNFTKFLVDRKGTVLKRFAPSESPEKLEPAIAKLLA